MVFQNFLFLETLLTFKLLSYLFFLLFFVMFALFTVRSSQCLERIVPFLVVLLHKDIWELVFSKFHCRITSLTRNGIEI